MVCTETRATFVTGRWNVDVFAAMGSGALVDRVSPSSTRNRPQMSLEGVPSHHQRFSFCECTNGP